MSACVMCGCGLTERQRLGSHRCCAPCLLKTLENDVEHGEYLRQDDPAAHPPIWLPFLVAIAACGAVWGFLLVI